jgi:hypothetical protein
MTESLVFKLNGPAVDKLNILMEQFKETYPDVMISRALGLLDIVKDYVDEEGILTVIDPKITEGSNKVELLFKKIADNR